MRRGSRWNGWSPVHLHRLLGREVYKGNGWYGRERHINTEDGRKRFSQPESTWISLPYPVLVEEETWERTQSLKRERQSRAKRNTRNLYLLQHLMVCEECGLHFTARTNTRNVARKNGRTYRYEYTKPMRYYTCRGMYSHKLKCREHPYLNADLVEGIVWSEVSRVLKNPDTILLGLQAQAAGQNAEELAEDIAQAERNMRAIQVDEDRAIRLYVSGKITEEHLDRQRKFITERLEHARTKRDSLTAQQRAVQHRESLSEGLLSWAREIQVGLDALTLEDRQQVLRLVLDQVGIDREGRIRITLAIPAPDSMSNAPRPPSSTLGTPGPSPLPPSLSRRPP